MATPIIYPEGLPGPRLSPYQAYELRKTTTSTPGQPEYASKEHARRGTQSVEFIFTFEQLPIWKTWISDPLVRAGAWFSAPKWRLPFAASAQRRFMSEPSHGEFFPGLGWRISAECEVREGPVPQLYDIAPPLDVFWSVRLNVGDIGAMTFGAQYAAYRASAFGWGVGDEGSPVWQETGPESTLGATVDEIQDVRFDFRDTARSYIASPSGDDHPVGEFTIIGSAFGIKLGVGAAAFGVPGLDDDITKTDDNAYYAWDGTHRNVVDGERQPIIYRGSWPQFRTGDVIGAMRIEDNTFAIFLNGIFVGPLVVPFLEDGNSFPYLFAVRSCPIQPEETGGGA